MIEYRVATRSAVAALSEDMRRSLAPTVTKQWAARWMAYIRRRFDRYSKGGGDWAPLAKSTVARRRYSKGGTIGGARRELRSGAATVAQAQRRAQALLNKATTPAQRKKAAAAMKAAGRKATSHQAKTERVAKAAGSAAILRDTGTLFRSTQPGAPGNMFEPVGTTGFKAGFAPTKHPSGKPTLAQIAAWHNRGSPGKYPARPILAPPDPQTMMNMMNDLVRGVRSMAGRAGFTKRGRP